MTADLVAYYLYIWDIEKVHMWSRYVAGLIECLRCMPWVFPNFKVHLTMGDDTVQLLRDNGHGKWARALERALDTAVIHTVKKVSIHRDVPFRVKNASMLPLLHRYDCIGDFDSNVRTVAFRDVDSPPTPADSLSVETMLDNVGILMIELPLHGTVVCGGGVTMLNLNHYRGALWESIAKYRPNGSAVDAWGIDEGCIERCITSCALLRYTFECYHCEECVTYHTTPDMSCPVIDRLSEYCTDACHWKMIEQPCRYESPNGVRNPCICIEAKPWVIPNLLRNHHHAYRAHHRVIDEKGSFKPKILTAV
jgi:hypothetical protein